MQFGEFRLDPSTRTLTRNSTRIALQPKLFDVLHYLVQHAGRALSKEELLAACWPRQTVGEAVLTRSMKELRKLLGESATRPGFIRTLPRVGYQFAEPVPAGTDRARVVAILPLRSRPRGADAEALAFALAEHLAASLGLHDALRVRPVAAVLGASRHGGGALEIGRRLGADIVIDGTLLHLTDRWQASLRLLGVGAGREIGVEVLDAPLDAPRDLLIGSARAVGARLCATPAQESQPLLGRPPANPLAYRHHLLGRLHLTRHTLPEDRRALACFEAAVAADPGFAMSWLGIADAQDALGSAEPSPARAAAARAAARQALDLEPDLVPAQIAMAKVAWRQDLDGISASRLFDAALARAPRDVSALTAASDFHALSGNAERAIGLAVSALEVDPTSPFAGMLLGQALHTAGLHDDALAQLARTLALHPDFAFAHLFAGLSLLCLAQPQAALQHLQRAATLSGRDDIEGARIFALAKAGHRSEAEAACAALQAGNAAPAAVALGLHGLGHDEAALECFARAAAAGDWRCILLHREPAFAQLRLHPRAADLWPPGLV
jgi:DNA-binding winged helix-turn-helix (wHTH) protein/tetratricopeptide (TPR) repeat protein